MHLLFVITNVPVQRFRDEFTVLNSVLQLTTEVEKDRFEKLVLIGGKVSTSLLLCESAAKRNKSVL
jgi:hypothetical protein